MDSAPRKSATKQNAGQLIHRATNFERLSPDATKIGFRNVAVAPLKPRFIRRSSAQSAADG